MMLSLHGHAIDEDARCVNCNRQLSALVSTDPPARCDEIPEAKPPKIIDEMNLEDYRRGVERLARNTVSLP